MIYRQIGHLTQWSKLLGEKINNLGHFCACFLFAPITSACVMINQNVTRFTQLSFILLTHPSFNLSNPLLHVNLAFNQILSKTERERLSEGLNAIIYQNPKIKSLVDG